LRQVMGIEIHRPRFRVGQPRSLRGRWLPDGGRNRDDSPTVRAFTRNWPSRRGYLQPPAAGTPKSQVAIVSLAIYSRPRAPKPDMCPAPGTVDAFRTIHWDFQLFATTAGHPRHEMGLVVIPAIARNGLLRVCGGWSVRTFLGKRLPVNDSPLATCHVRLLGADPPPGSHC
jgi:hypothetical protein